MEFLSLDSRIRDALLEDLGRGDVTTQAVLEEAGLTPAGRPARASLVAKQELTLAGWPVFVRVFEMLGPVRAEVHFEEGQRVGPGAVGRLEGDAAVLLRGERVALNLLQRMCGVATATRALADRIAHTRARLLDTRKTTPLWRSLEKYAVRAGGGHNHRMGLDDAILIKENHIAVAGGVEAAILACRRHASHLLKIEIEVRTLEELERAVAAGAEVVMLDNMTPALVRQAVQQAGGRCLLEVSGGIDADTVVQFAETGVDFISVGALTHSYRSADLSLLIETS